MELDLTQKLALAKATRWLDKRMIDPKVKQVHRIGGAAGSGKTTMIRKLVDHCIDNEIKYVVCTPSGKASAVLTKKGIESKTIHRIFYQPNPKAIARVADINEELRGSLTAEERQTLRAELKTVSKNMFIRRVDTPYDFIIVDEASMVSAGITNQLKSFGVPILAVGDPSQLPPVDKGPGEPLFANQKPDSMLDGSHRFGDSDLLGEVAKAARENTPIPAEVFSEEGDIDFLDYDVVLVATNPARWKYTHAIRGARRLPLDRPVEGDRIVFWKNRGEVGAFNGDSMLIETITDEGEGWAVTGPSESGQEMDIVVDKRGFHNQVQLETARDRSRHVVASFSEALTVHKAQGSEWDRVLVVGDYWKPEDRQAWRYTAVTRAAKKLTVVSDSMQAPVKEVKKRQRRAS